MKTQEHYTCNNRKKKKLFGIEPNYNPIKFFTENMLAIEMKTTQIYMKKPVYFGLLILEMSKTIMHEFWYD